MKVAEAVFKILMLLAEPLSVLIANAIDDDKYDPEVERQALLDMNRKLADDRLKKTLSSP